MMWILWRILGPITRRLPRSPTSLDVCPWCGHEHVTNWKDLCERSGGSYYNDYGKVHWADGVVECPRCRFVYYVYLSE